MDITKIKVLCFKGHHLESEKTAYKREKILQIIYLINGHTYIQYKEVLQLKRWTITSVDKDVEKLELSYTAGMKIEWLQPLWKTVWLILKG